MTRFSLFLAATIYVVSVCGVNAQAGLDCSVFSPDVLRSNNTVTAPALPDKLLADWNAALPCLIRLIEQEKENVKSPDIEPEARARLLRATGAIRSIIANSTSPEATRAIIGKFRNLDNLDVISVLAFGGRSNDYNMRLNSILILANVIDNTTVCVPIDHLYASDISINGRANLLGIISVVAPWAYRQNYDNIDKIRKAIAAKTADNPEMQQTNAILHNIETRLNANSENRNSDLPSSMARGCQAYAKKAQWAKDILVY